MIDLSAESIIYDYESSYNVLFKTTGRQKWT